MDKQILEYLDKVGEKIGGVAEQGFDVYVHGVFVESLINSIIGFLMIIVPIAIVALIYKHEKKYGVDMDDELFILIIFGSLLGIALIITGVVTLICSVTGVFAPDYVAIKNIVENVKN